MKSRNTIITFVVIVAGALVALGVTRILHETFPPRPKPNTDVCDLEPVDEKSMGTASYGVGSRKDVRALGGGNSSNYPIKIDARTPGAEGRLTLVALPTETLQFQEFQGFRLLLINRTNSEVAFQACSSGLDLICEALDAKGQWQAIESEPLDLCAYGFHRVFLPRQHYWEIAAPKFTGGFKTKLRFHLLHPELYSGEFEGEINEGQFSEMPLLGGR